MSLKYRDANGVEQGIAGTPYDVLKELDDKLDAIQTYSTEEQVVGTWIDGKPIYRKVYNFTTAAGSSVATVRVPSGIPNIEHVISMNGYIDVVSGTETYQMPIQWVHSQGIFAGVYYQYSTASFFVSTTRSTENDKPAVLIVEYTKTTD
jgi:hypothetical protein